MVKEAKELVSLTDADIICSGGRGLGNAEGFTLIRKFADKVGGVVGASRAAVDAGWIDPSPVSYTHLAERIRSYILYKVLRQEKSKYSKNQAEYETQKGE